MTAFEVHLNNIYEIIENNEPTHSSETSRQLLTELIENIKRCIDSSYHHGDDLTYKNFFKALLKTAELSLQNASHEDWAMVKYKFLDNDLNLLRKKRNSEEIQRLKKILDKDFSQY